MRRGSNPSKCGLMRSCIGLCVVAALAGCAVGPDFKEPNIALPERLGVDLELRTGPAGLPGAARSAQAAEIARWWQALGDTELDSLVDRALRDNLDLEIALERLQQARTLELALTGTALPRVEVSAGGARGTGSDLTRGRVPSALGSADRSTGSSSRITQISGFDAAWDLDLFGRLRRQIEAARYDAQAAAAARDAVQVAVIADVVRAYVDLRGLQMQLAVLRENRKTAQALLDLVQARFERGITNELDATLARRQLATVDADLHPLQSQIESTQQVIAVLVGRYPQDLAAELGKPGLIPQVPESIDPGLPLDLIRRRPDIRVSEWALAGATARVGVATANLFPQLALTTGIGMQGQGLGYKPSNHESIWSAGYAAYFPLLDFGVLDALVDIADLRTREEFARYKLTVQHAVQEVDTAISAFVAQQARLADLGDAIAASQRAVLLSTERYERGLTDFLNVVDAQRHEFELEGQYTLAQTVLAEQYVGVYRALGGGWEQYAGPPQIRTPQPAVLAMLRRLVVPDSGAQANAQ